MAYATGQANAVKHPNISDAISDFDPVLDRAQQYAERLQKIHDRILGPRPAEVGGNKLDAPPHSVIGSINERRSRLVAILDSIEQAVVGIESSV